MPNSLLTISQITRKALALLRNTNAFLQTCSRQFDAEWRGPAKIGSSLRIRVPNDFTVRSGATASPQNTNEQNVVLTMATMKGVDVEFTSQDLSQSLDDFGDRVLSPMVNVLAGAVASDLMTVAEGVPNLVHNVDVSNNTISPTAATYLAAGAVLDSFSCPRGNRKALLDPMTSSRTITTMLGLFNPTPEIAKQFRTGWMGASNGTLGIDDWRVDQTVIKHTEGASTFGTATSVDATGTILTTSALSGAVKVGDVITIAGLHSVNRVTKASNNTLCQFVVTAAAGNGTTTLHIYPAIVPPSGGDSVAYQTVDSALSGGSAIASPVNASEVYRKNLVFDPQAFAFVTGQLDLPTGAAVECARETFDGISIRMIRDYITLSDLWVTRLDILYGFALVRPEWAVIVCDAV